MLQAVIIVITGNGAKYNEPVLFMRIMVSVCVGGGDSGVSRLWVFFSTFGTCASCEGGARGGGCLSVGS
jgi:hypothetical protein